MQNRPTRIQKSRPVRRKLGEIERLESRRVMTSVPPDAINDLFHVQAGQALEISGPGVLANDISFGGPLAAHLFSGPTSGEVTMAEDGSFTYTPADGFTGIDSFMYWASDADAGSLLAAVTLRVSTDGGGPLTSADSYAVNEDEVLGVTAPAGVLDNDTAMSGGNLTAELVTGPEHGTLSLAEDGSFTYTPSANYNGADSFTYIAHEGSTSSAPTAVSLTVRPRNDKPVSANDAFSMDEDGSLVVDTTSVLANDSDVDGDTLTANLVRGPLHGSVELHSDGTFTYTPTGNFHGVDGFSYLASDGTSSSEVATVTINVASVNDLPVASNDEYTLDEDTSLTIDASGILGNDSDADGDALLPVLVSGPQNGSLTLNDDGSFIYTPNANFNGVDGFSYLVSDGTDQSSVATVTLNVNSINDAPVANNDEVTIDEDSNLTIDLPGVLANDSDGDGDALTAVLVSGPQNGTLTLNSDGSFSYTPSGDFNGVDGFSYLVSDGTMESSVATVTINVNPVNDAPVANNDEYTIDEDAVLTVDASGILTNDTDGDGDALLPVLVTGPQNGTLTFNNDGSFVYTPNTDFNGVDGFSYMVNDGTMDSAVATVTINVNPTNDAPVANNDEYTIDEDSNLTIDLPGVLANDTDGDGDALNAVLVSGPQNGTLRLNADGSFNYTPSADFSGVDGFSYLVNDGTTDSSVATVTINVNPTNDAPAANNDEYTIDEDSNLNIDLPGVLANDTDGDGDALTALLVSGPQNGTLTLNADGSFNYTPSADFSGVDGFSYLVNDGTTDSAVATVTIHVNPTNDGPSAADDAYSVEEDSVLAVDPAGVLANDTDPDGDALTPTVVTGPQHGTLAMNSDGSFSYTPEANFHGSDSFTYVVSDGTTDSSPATVSIDVTPVNDAPQAADDSYTVDEDHVLTIDAPGVLGNDTDLDGDGLTAVLVNGPQHGTLALNSDGSFSYTPDHNYNGEDSFTYQALDGSSASQEVTVSIVVNPLPDAPTANSDFTSGGEDSSIFGNVLDNDFDGEDGSLTATLVTGPAHGSLTLSEDGSFSYTPQENWFGQDTFTYVANNGEEDSELATVTLNIDPINDPPVGSIEGYNIGAGETLVVNAADGLLSNDTDIESDALIARLVRGPRHGTLTMSDDGSFTYTADDGFLGEDSFTYQPNDGRADGAVTRVSILVGQPTSGGNENHAPIAAADNFVVARDQTLAINAPGVLANDSDLDLNALTAQIVTGPTHGALTLNSDGSFSYTPEAGFIGEDSFTYAASDGTAASDPATVTIAVNDISSGNVAPTSADDQFITSVNTPLNIPAAGVLGNDSDANGDALSAVIVSQPTHGTLALAADGSFAYTPNAGYSGTDAFTYQATDGALAGNTATVTITIATTENTRPNAVNDQFTTPADTPLTIAAAGVLANDSDAQGDAMTALLFSGPQHGTVSLASDGSFAYTPSAGYVGIDSFIYRVFDGQKYSALAAVTVRVTARPVALHAGALEAVAAGRDDDGWLADAIDGFFSSEEGWA